jgi:predicted aspartyl protease
MFLSPLIVVAIMLLLPAGSQPENPWKEKVPAAIQRAEQNQTPAAFQEALDVAWRADDWQAGLRLAEQALAKHPDQAELRGPIVRALWRAGQIERAESLAAKIPADTDDRVSLRSLLGIHLARGQATQAEQLAQRLETLQPQTAQDLYYVLEARLTRNRLDGLADLLRRAERLTDARNGYPDIYVAEEIEGVAEFLEAVGTAPLNQIVQPGAAPMPPLVMLNLPSCEAYINGRGPFRLVVDTGGSIMVALDQQVADEIGLKSAARATVRGVSGKQETSQALIEDLQIGTIKCRRVLTRVFDVRGAIMNAADGILGTGVFAQGRMTLDLAGGQLAVSPSREEAGPGQPVELRIVGDAKLMAMVTLEGQPANALLDTGADAVALAPSRLKKLFPDRPIQKFSPGLALGVGSEQMPEISLGSGVELVIAGRRYKNYGGVGLDVLDDILSPVMGIQTDILLGMPTFRDMRSCTVDFPRCKMWIDWLGGE